MWSMVRDAVLDRVLSHTAVKKIRTDVERQVRDGELTPRSPRSRLSRRPPSKINRMVTIRLFADLMGHHCCVTHDTVRHVDGGLPRGVQGAADPNFTCAVRAFSKLFPGPRFGGGALSVYLDGRPVIDVWTGWSDRRGEVPWTADTGAMVFSATKGLASTVIHRLVDRGLLDYDVPMAEYWPDFGVNGKHRITLRDVMRHRAGLSHLSGVSSKELLDHRLMEERLAVAPVGRFFGVPAYHALTYGWLMSGLARAVTGMGMRDLIRTELAAPLNTDGLHWAGRRPTRQLGQRRYSIRRAPVRTGHSTSGAPAGRALVLRRVRRNVFPGRQGFCAG